MSGDLRSAPSAAGARLWRQRLGWLLVLWIAGVLAVGLVALAFRLLMGAIGLTR